MFGIGMPEMVVILALALIILGPKKLPDLAKSLGRALGEFKKASRELKDAISIEDDLEDVKQTLRDVTTEFSASDAHMDAVTDASQPQLPADDSEPTTKQNKSAPKGPLTDD